MQVIGTAGIIGAAIAIGTFIKAVMEYRSAQKWKRAEFIANIIKSFFGDPVNKRALIILDWEDKLIGFEDVHGKKIVVRVTWPLAAEALRSDPDKGSFTKREILIRDTFSEFFDNLSVFEHHINSNLYHEDEIREYLIYWVDQIYNDLSVEFRRSLFSFLNYYKYTAVLSLLNRYSKRSDNSRTALPSLLHRLSTK
jgi:hypothetical protein